MKNPSLSSLCITLALITSFIPAAVDGWWDFGHMVVAEIARRNLDNDVARVVETYIQHLSESGPFPNIPDFVQSACWPDDLKRYRMDAMDGWHYTANMYIRDGFKPNVTLKQNSDVVSVINGLSKALRRTDTPIYVRSFALAHLVHYYGDIHQPLHTTSQVSADYPEGDQGGNLVHVDFRGVPMKLHAVWDSICRGPSESLERPLNTKDYTKVRDFATKLIATYKFSQNEKEQTNPVVMSREGFELAKKVAYANVVNGTELSEEYISACKEMAEKRITLAGYRLATHLNTVLRVRGEKREANPDYVGGDEHLFAEDQ
ncbi:single strand-specific nuclease [Trypanosoma brucei equiperdum]|uniref:Single strand-specific nuclease n=1 Tax=Trypanosoma brucei equiperdum TaxID=630700 RepID=A0A3L6L876_9TRYP|nr:single strand-specific nuclease [Trypanosoma brucei equiperdum]